MWRRECSRKIRRLCRWNCEEGLDDAVETDDYAVAPLKPRKLDQSFGTNALSTAEASKAQGCSPL